MLNKFLFLAFALIAALGLLAVPFPDGAVGLMLVVILSTFALFMYRRYTEEKEFVTSVFLIGLTLRLGFGLLLHIFDAREFFGGDANAYDKIFA